MIVHGRNTIRRILLLRGGGGRSLFWIIQEKQKQESPMNFQRYKYQECTQPFGLRNTAGYRKQEWSTNEFLGFSHDDCPTQTKSSRHCNIIQHDVITVVVMQDMSEQKRLVTRVQKVSNDDSF